MRKICTKYSLDVIASLAHKTAYSQPLILHNDFIHRHCILKLSTFKFLFNFILKLFYCCSITVVCIFPPPLSPTLAKPISLPCFCPPPWFFPVSFIVFPENSSSHFCPLPSGYCQIVLNFNVSGYILLACL